MSDTPEDEASNDDQPKDAANEAKEKQWTLKDWEDGKIPPDEMKRISEEFAKSFKAAR